VLPELHAPRGSSHAALPSSQLSSHSDKTWCNTDCAKAPLAGLSHSSHPHKVPQPRRDLQRFKAPSSEKCSQLLRRTAATLPRHCGLTAALPAPEPVRRCTATLPDLGKPPEPSAHERHAFFFLSFFLFFFPHAFPPLIKSSNEGHG